MLVVLSCAGLTRTSQPLPPGQAAAGVWQRLGQLKSFGFSLSFRTDTPAAIAVSFDGVREQSGREMWSGTMRRGKEASHVDLRADGSEQYEREPSGWIRTVRGVETRVLDQGASVFRGSRLEFTGAERGRYTFAFRPDLPIVDPTRTKKLSGVIEVDPFSGLPIRLYCSDSAGTAEWELRLFRFNRARKVDIPFLPLMTVDALPTRRLGRGAYGQAVMVLDRRLAELGWEHRLNRSSGRLTLLLSQQKSHRQIELLFSRGSVEAWLGRWVGAGASADAVEVGGDASRRAELTRLLASNRQLGVEVIATTPLAATLQVSSVHLDSGNVAFLVVDGDVLSAAHPNSSGGLEFADIGGEEDVRVIAALAHCGVIPADFVVTVRD